MSGKNAKKTKNARIIFLLTFFAFLVIFAFLINLL